jgi:hypothetical protein
VAAEHALFTLLNADATLAALIGAGDLMRVRPIELPTDVLRPAVVWLVVSEVRLRAGGGYAGITRSRVQILVCADEPDEILPVDAAILAILGDYRGTVETDSGDVVILDCDRMSLADLPRSEQTRYYRRATDYQFQWRAA